MSDWLVDPDAAYLNHGGYGALPVVVAAAAAALRAEVERNPTDVLARQWQGRVDTVRHRVAGFLRAPADDLVFVANATAGTATVLRSVSWSPGDEVITTDHRYGAIGRQLAAIAEQHGVKVHDVHVPVDASRAADVVALLMSAIGPRTKLLLIDHIASPTGFVFPVAELTVAAHAAGVAVLIDAAHSPGQVDVDVASIGADFWVGNLHKWVCSPRACAALHVAPECQHTVRPLVPSHGYAGGFRPAFDWTGTFDPIPLLAVPAALDFWDAVGWDDARKQQRALATAGAHHIADTIGTRVAVADEFSAAMRIVELPFALDEAGCAELQAHLTVEHRVTAAVTLHAGTTYVRVCGQLYNSPDDYARLADALKRWYGSARRPPS